MGEHPKGPQPDEEDPHETAGSSSVPKISGYEVLGVLGRGGMGVVFKARHLRLDHINVALKMILDADRAGCRRG